MLLSDLELFVYKVDNENFELLGTVEKFSSLIWPNTFKGYSDFELWAPITEQNNELLKQGNILWTRGSNACIIEIINPQLTEKGERKYLVKGRTLECLLEDRIIWGTYSNKDKISTIMYDIVDKNCINPEDEKRKIPWLVRAEDLFLGDEVSFQKTGQTVYTALDSVIGDNINIGFSINFDPRNKKLIFEVLEGKDLSIGNESGNDPVELSTEFDDILESDYYSNVQEVRTIAYIQGEVPKDEEGKETGEPRREATIGDLESSGFNRKELYVDARDLQSVIFEEGSMESKTIPLEEYIESLELRGKDKLSLYEKIEEFTVKIRTFGLTQYNLGEDYFLGDTITIIDKELNVRVNVQVKEAKELFDSRYQLELTFGFMKPTIIDKIRRLVV